MELKPRLIDVAVPDRAAGVVLALHGGAGRPGNMMVSPTQLSVLPIVPSRGGSPGFRRVHARPGFGRLSLPIAKCYYGGMAERRTIAMLLLHSATPRDIDARRELAAALPDAEVTEPDELGVFEVSLVSDGQEHALERVWDGIAASGTDDHIAFLEHPELPEHWRHRSRPPGG